MVRVFAFLGVLAVAIVVAIIAFVGVTVFKAADQIEEGTAYARSVLETYGEEWDPAFIRGEAGEELLATDPNFELLSFAFNSNFGTIETIDSFECPMWEHVQEGTTKFAFVLACRASARSTKGQLDVEMHVVKREAWKTNTIWIHGMEPLDTTPAARAVSVAVAAEIGQARLGQPTLGDCGQLLGLGTGGLKVSRGCMAGPVETHSAGR